MITRLLDLLAPRFCVMCESRLSSSEDCICTNCVIEIPRTHYATSPQDNPMARLFWGHIDVVRAAAWMVYQPGSNATRIIRLMKYHHRPDAAQAAGRIAAREMAAEGFFDGVDFLLPVPLTPQRERTRGYNQSRELAQGISAMTGIPILDRAVMRIHFSESQTRQTPADRRRNVEGAFTLAQPEAVRGRHVMVVDDVVTTGSTMQACCKEMVDVPGVRISIFALGLTSG